MPVPSPRWSDPDSGCLLIFCTLLASPQSWPALVVTCQRNRGAFWVTGSKWAVEPLKSGFKSWLEAFTSWVSVGGSVLLFELSFLIYKMGIMSTRFTKAKKTAIRRVHTYQALRTVPGQKHWLNKQISPTWTSLENEFFFFLMHFQLPAFNFSKLIFFRKMK